MPNAAVPSKAIIYKILATFLATGCVLGKKEN
jgi:hypothetical protein